LNLLTAAHLDGVDHTRFSSTHCGSGQSHDDFRVFRAGDVAAQDDRHSQAGLNLDCGSGNGSLDDGAKQSQIGLDEHFEYTLSRQPFIFVAEGDLSQAGRPAGNKESSGFRLVVPELYNIIRRHKDTEFRQVFGFRWKFGCPVHCPSERNYQLPGSWVVFGEIQWRRRRWRWLIRYHRLLTVGYSRGEPSNQNRAPKKGQSSKSFRVHPITSPRKWAVGATRL
jgi:hypothetical protein